MRGHVWSGRRLVREGKRRRESVLNEQTWKRPSKIFPYCKFSDENDFGVIGEGTHLGGFPDVSLGSVTINPPWI
jgi:hypothetical protein